MSKVLDDGAKSTDYTTLVSWISQQLLNFGDVEECINPVQSPQDFETFHLELSFLLKELGCVNEKLTSGSVNERLASRQDRLLLLDYLVTELITSKLLALRHPKKKDNSMEITVVNNFNDYFQRNHFSEFSFLVFRVKVQLPSASRRPSKLWVFRSHRTISLFLSYS